MRTELSVQTSGEKGLNSRVPYWQEAWANEGVSERLLMHCAYGLRSLQDPLRTAEKTVIVSGSRNFDVIALEPFHGLFSNLQHNFLLF